MTMKQAIQYRVKNGKAILKKLNEKYANARMEKENNGNSVAESTKNHTNSEMESTKKEE